MKRKRVRLSLGSVYQSASLFVRCYDIKHKCFCCFVLTCNYVNIMRLRRVDLDRFEDVHLDIHQLVPEGIRKSRSRIA